jgi:DNA-binding transcriptional ArsR family regulator
MDAFMALADPTRRAIVELLAQRGELAATEIAGYFPISAPAVSQHLKVLREAGVLVVEKRAQQRIYRINPQTMHAVESWAGRMTQRWQARFDALEDLLREEMEAQAGAHRLAALTESGRAEDSEEKKGEA